MENTTCEQAVTGGSVLRDLQGLTMSSEALTSRSMMAVAAAQGWTDAPVDHVSTPYVGSYATIIVPTPTDRAVSLRGLVADHKFSTRLGPSASPPV